MMKFVSLNLKVKVKMICYLLLFLTCYNYFCHCEFVNTTNFIEHFVVALSFLGVFEFALNTVKTNRKYQCIGLKISNFN